MKLFRAAIPHYKPGPQEGICIHIPVRFTPEEVRDSVFNALLVAENRRIGAVGVCCFGKCEQQSVAEKEAVSISAPVWKYCRRFSVPEIYSSQQHG